MNITLFCQQIIKGIWLSTTNLTSEFSVLLILSSLGGSIKYLHHSQWQVEYHFFQIMYSYVRYEDKDSRAEAAVWLFSWQCVFCATMPWVRVWCPSSLECHFAQTPEDIKFPAGPIWGWQVLCNTTVLHWNI